MKYKIVTNHYRSNVRNEILGIEARAEAVAMAYDILCVYDHYDFVQMSETSWLAKMDGQSVVSVEVVESDEVLTA